MPNAHLADATIRPLVSAKLVPPRKLLIDTALALEVRQFRPLMATLLVQSCTYSHAPVMHPNKAPCLAGIPVQLAACRSSLLLVLANSPFVPLRVILPAMFFSRRSRGPDRYFRWKTATLLAGIGVALVGFELESRWVVNLAIAVVLVGFSLRFFDRGAR